MTSSTLYSSPFTVSTSVTVKAIAIKSGYNNSSVTSADFTIGPSGLYQTSFFNDANLVGYWRFENNSNDSIGINHGTDYNIAYGSSSGKFGQGALFNSTPNSYIQKNNPSGLPTGNHDLTLSVWVNPRVEQSTGVPSLVGWGSEGYYQMSDLLLGDYAEALYWGGYANDVSQAYDYSTGVWQKFWAIEITNEC